jgi:hypothetical protein
MSIAAKATPSSKLLTPKDHALILIDFQSQRARLSACADCTLQVPWWRMGDGRSGIVE